jgi:hypothetical protein
MLETARLYKYNVPLLQLGYYFLTNVSPIVCMAFKLLIMHIKNLYSLIIYGSTD